jgi:hypothetical protein
MGGSTEFSFMEDSQDDFDVDFHCPKCGSEDVKRRIGQTDVEPPSMRVEELIRDAEKRSFL